MFGLSGFLRHGSSVARTIAFVIGGEFCFTKTGSGTTTMAALHTYTGPTVIKAGTLSVSVLADGGVASHVGASANAASNLVLDGGTIEYTGTTTTIDRDVAIRAGGGTVSVTAATELDVGGLVSDGMTHVSNITKSGAGVLRLNKKKSGAFSGNIAITGGTLIAGVDDALPSLTYILSAGAVLDLNGFDLLVARLSGAGNVYLGSATVTIINGSALSGVISGTGGVTKTTVSNQALYGANTYTGPTTINAGTLQINTLANGGLASSIGASSSDASNLVLSGGVLLYQLASDATTDRAFTLSDGTTSTIRVDSSVSTVTFNGGTAATTGGFTKLNAGKLALGPCLHTGLSTCNGGKIYFMGGAAGSITTANAVGVRVGVGSAATVAVAGNLTIANGNLSGIEVHTNGATVASRFDVAGAFNGGNTGGLVDILGALDIGDYIIVNASSHTGLSPTIGINSSGHSASLSLVAGVLTLHIT